MATEVYPMTESPDREKSRPVHNMNVNRYATKKTIAQGMLDIALLTANASQLKYVLQIGKEKHPFYTLMITLISISITLQVISGVLVLSLQAFKECRLHLLENVGMTLFLNYLQVALSSGIAGVNIVISAFDPAVGICFLFIGSLNINKPKSQRTADILNNLITVMIFLITVINVVISSFGIEQVVLEEDKFRKTLGRREATTQVWEVGSASNFFDNGTLQGKSSVSFQDGS